MFSSWGLSRSRLGCGSAKWNVDIVDVIVQVVDGEVGGPRGNRIFGATLPPTTWTESCQCRRIVFIFLMQRDMSLLLIR